ncbi:MAG: hypothetical protein AMXMBFR84_17680 [Candidatus Hydrogenedentota bacterium]
MKAEEYAHLRRAEQAHWWYLGLNRLLKHHWNNLLSQETQLRVLDAGCGTGDSLLRLGENVEKHGIDAAIEALSYCRLSHLYNTCRASVLDLPYPDSCFDVVINLDVIYHRNVPDPEVALKEMLRVLRPGGYAFINVPAYEWLRSSHDEHIQTARRFTRRSLVELLDRAGFAVVRVSYWNTLLFPAAAAIRVWRKADPKPASDVAELPGAITNHVCGLALALERGWLRVLPLPFGLSVFAVARKSN